MSLTGKERVVGDDELIVSKTDLLGRITYANRTFFKYAGYSPQQIRLAPHSIVRHPHMPRCVFKFLWDCLNERQEVFAYVINRAVNGDHYWVFAHVTPSRGRTGEVVGYHSNRRSVNRQVVNDVIVPLYADLQRIEQQDRDGKQGCLTALNHLTGLLAKSGKSYAEFIMSL